MISDERRAAMRFTAEQLPLSSRDLADLLDENDRLRDEISDRANVEADLRAQLAEEKAARR